MFLVTSFWILGQQMVRWRPCFKRSPYEPLHSDVRESVDNKRALSWFFNFALNTLLVCLTVGVQNVLGNLLPVYIYRTYKVENTLITTAFWCSFIGSRLSCTYAIWKIGTRNVMLSSLAIATIGAIILAISFSRGITLLWVGVIITSLGLGPSFPASVTWAKNNLDIAKGGLSLIFVLATFCHAGLGAIVTYSFSIASQWFYGCFVLGLTGLMLLNTICIAAFNYYRKTI
jgi:MFS family permease